MKKELREVCILNWTNLLVIFVLSIAIFALYTMANMYFLSKIKVSKWFVLALAIAFLVIGVILPAYSTNVIINYIPTGIFVFLFLWYADISGLSKLGAPKPKVEPKTTIKPKAKPNKLKYTDEKDIIKTETEKKKKKKKKK